MHFLYSKRTKNQYRTAAKTHSQINTNICYSNWENILVNYFWRKGLQTTYFKTDNGYRTAIATVSITTISGSHFLAEKAALNHGRYSLTEQIEFK